MALYQRGPSWYYDFWREGRRYRQSLGVVSREVAAAVLAEVKRTVADHVARAKVHAIEATLGLSPRLEDVASEYLAYYRTHAKSRSVRRHEQAYRALHPVFGSVRLADITPRRLEQYKQQRLQAGRHPATINRELAFLKHLFTMAITWGKASENPVKRVRLLHEDNGRTRWLTAEEEARLLAACPRALTPVVLTALHTGLRSSELLSLRWGHVDLPQRRLTVPASYSKNGQARTVPMNDLVVRTLSAIKETEEPAAFVFNNRRGRPYRSCRTAFATACRKAGLAGFRFHDLRHTFASRLVMAGVHLAVVKELLGHKVLTMTMRYTHLAPAHHQAAVALLASPDGSRAPASSAVSTALPPGPVRLADAHAIVQALIQLGVVDTSPQGC